MTAEVIFLHCPECVLAIDCVAHMYHTSLSLWGVGYTCAPDTILNTAGLSGLLSCWHMQARMRMRTCRMRMMSAKGMSTWTE